MADWGGPGKSTLFGAKRRKHFGGVFGLRQRFGGDFTPIARPKNFWGVFWAPKAVFWVYFWAGPDRHFLHFWLGGIHAAGGGIAS